VTKPIFATPPTRHSAPTITASIPAMAIRESGSAPASGMMAAATSGAMAESGATTRIRDGPNTAYARSGIMVAYTPVISGMPARDA
jgi:hypothetical protein